jgi:hypothetical protein
MSEPPLLLIAQRSYSSDHRAQPPRSTGSGNMSRITTKDGTGLFYKDRFDADLLAFIRN